MVLLPESEGIIINRSAGGPNWEFANLIEAYMYIRELPGAAQKLPKSKKKRDSRMPSMMMSHH